MFSKDIELPVASDAMDKRNRCIRYVVDARQGEPDRGEDRRVALCADNLARRFTVEAAIAVMPIVDEFEAPELESPVPIVGNHWVLNNRRLYVLFKRSPVPLRHGSALGMNTASIPNFRQSLKTMPKERGVTIASSQTQVVVDLQEVLLRQWRLRGKTRKTLRYVFPNPRGNDRIGGFDREWGRLARPQELG
jgi:hypothetical protein